MVSHKELVGEIVEHPEHGRGRTCTSEKLYPQLLVDIFDDDSLGTPVINPQKMDENDWEIITEIDSKSDSKTKTGDSE